jgi:hypothetical protein
MRAAACGARKYDRARKNRSWADATPAAMTSRPRATPTGRRSGFMEGMAFMECLVVMGDTVVRELTYDMDELL